MDFNFKHPTTIQICGPTGCGKTWFVRHILEEQLIQPFPTRIIWVYSEWQSDYEHVRVTFPHVEFVEGWREDLYASIRPEERNLLILDDQMDEAGNSKTLSKLFTKGSHHRNLTVIYLVQNVFNQSKSQRTVSLNSHYNVVFRNRRCRTRHEWSLYADAFIRFATYVQYLPYMCVYTDDNAILSTTLLLYKYLGCGKPGLFDVF